MTSLFVSVTQAPRDPILGLNEQYNADSRSNKVNLGVGVYYDDVGRLPLMKAVQAAEAKLTAAANARGYLPIEGMADYNRGAQQLLLGADSPAIKEGRAVTVQTLGGTGALKIGADFLKQLVPNATVLISDPSWENHRALFETAGFPVNTYRYYDPTTRRLDFDGMLADLKAQPANTIVVLHACCHNPTGVDPTFEQWQHIADVVQENKLIPFLDIAYQGFGQGLDEDAAAVRLFAERGINTFISSSFSKSFSLYGERVGALTLLTHSAEEAQRVLSQVKRVIRTNYSNPPTHGGKVVALILNDPELFALWRDELAEMRGRIRSMREQLVAQLQQLNAKQNFDFVLQQQGMFSYSGLNAAQVDRLRDEQGIYAVGTGRICVAALNSTNLQVVCQAITNVL
ncbi:MAG TPA: aspartate/tyrosine/aromatic aminotransferase [Candidatus Paenalcaligenes intestinipullorum]|uniref:Aminotransferase n=1 Tax=Candidatus Paenalcaligenes intestinipullorum TaxID=2838718 RepID=A0A9D2RJF4_9BURK|nr:aspartate/tyrosine/aromatic aminotransferase [Candidatus Paenalcaligenes intestinipullorum]